MAFTAVSHDHRVLPPELTGTSSEALVEESGVVTWGATDDTAELTLNHLADQTLVIPPLFGYVKATGITVADGWPVTDMVITSGALTVARTAHAEGAIQMLYRVIGRGKNTAV